MTFKEFVASHTGRHFFDSFREFVATFKTYVEHLRTLNERMAEYKERIQAATQQQGCQGNCNHDEAPTSSMPAAAMNVEGDCIKCGKTCTTGTSVVLGYQGHVRLLCDPCATEMGVLTENHGMGGN